MALRSRPKLNALPRRAEAEISAEVDPGMKPKAPRPPSRQGREPIGFFASKEAKRQLLMIALDEDRTAEGLMLEAMNLLFQSRSKARVAEQKK